MLNNNPVSVDEFRTKLSEFIGRVVYGRDRIVIKKYNREAAILLSIEEYERLIDPTKRFTKEEWKKGFEFIDKARMASKDVPIEEAEALIEKAIKEVRNAKNAKSRS